jgi:hypothetical protein
VKRVAAVLAALAMVSIAVAARSAIDADDDGGGGGGGDGHLVVLCATDLEDACRALGGDVEVRIADPAATTGALADGTVGDDVDAWITSTAWIEVADSRAGDALEDQRALATSRVVVAAAPQRLAAIELLCRGDNVWRCLGDAAGEPWSELGGPPRWGDLEVGLADPDSAVGLPVLASAAVGYFDDQPFAGNDLTSAEFQTWLGRLAASTGRDPDPARTMATATGAYSAAGTVAPVAARLSNRGVERVDYEGVIATIAAVELRGGDGLPNTDPVRRALEEDGWLAANDDHLAPTLRPGVMAALYTAWTEVT